MYNSLTAANCRRLPSMDFSSAVVNQAFLSPSAPDFSGGAPDGYVVGTNLNITFYTSPIFDSSSVSKGDPPPFSARLISYFDSEPKPDLGISLFDIHVFPKGLWEYDNNCNGTFFTTSWPIPNDTLSKIDPPFHAFRLLIYNATAALATPNETGIYHFSPGFYIKQDNNASTQPEAVAIPGTDLTGKGAVKPPSGGEIAAHGAIGIGAGLFIIVVALTGQLLFLEYRRTRIGRSQLGTWQDKMNLTDVSQVDTKRENRVNYNKPLPPTPPGSRLDSPVSALSVMTVPERRLGYTAGTNEQ